MTSYRSEQFSSRFHVNISSRFHVKTIMTGTKWPRNDFVLVSCKHDANFDIRADLTLSRSHINGASVSLILFNRDTFAIALEHFRTRAPDIS